MRSLLLGLLLVAPLSAGAQPFIGEFLDYKMLNTEANPFQYYLDAREGATPPDLSVSGVESVLQSAVQQWDSVACAATAFSYQGQLSHPEVPSTNDGYSVALIWVRSPSDPAYDYVLGGGTVVAAARARTHAGVLDTCDIFINAVGKKWSISSTVPTDALDLKTALLHELGHCQGLDHNFLAADAVMDSHAVVVGQARSLTADDRAHLCAWLPKSGQVGSPCTPGESCGAPGLTCVPAGENSDYAFCSRACGPEVNEGCPDPYVCEASNAIEGASRICVPPTGLVVDVGAACQEGADCGASPGICREVGPSTTRPLTDTSWEEGYCTQTCGVGGESCPFGSVCEALRPGEERCLQTCRVGTADCRDGYVCQPREGGDGVCEPRCTSNAACGPDALCRTCDGMCLQRGVGGKAIGDACEEDADCGTSQHCLKREGASGVCTQRCDTACSPCPSGTTCYSIGSERLCLRNCEDGSMCADALQCAPLESGGACFPACQGDESCPVGNVCEDGTCLDPNEADGGCGALCRPDAGGPKPPVTPPPPTTSGGCGCQGGVAGVSLWALGGMAGLLLLGRRRRA